MARKKYKGHSWFACPVCGAPAGDPCKNYKGTAKQICPRRKQLDEFAMGSIPVRDKGKEPVRTVYVELFPEESGEDIG